MTATYLLKVVPLHAKPADASPRNFEAYVVCQPEFGAGQWTAQDLGGVVDAHPLLGNAAPPSIDIWLMPFAKWVGKKQLNTAESIRATATFMPGSEKSAATRAELLNNLRALLESGGGSATATKMSPSRRFDEMEEEQFCEVATGHHVVHTLTRATSYDAYSTLAEFDLKPTTSRSAQAWIEVGRHAAVLEAIYSRNSDAYIAMAAYAEPLARTVQVLRKVERRMEGDEERARKVACEPPPRLKTSADSGGVAVEPSDPNVAIHAALRSALASRVCGIATKWAISATADVVGDYVIFLDIAAAAPTVPAASVPTVFRRRTHTHPLSFRDSQGVETTTCALAQLQSGGASRYQATCVNAEAALVKDVIVQRDNSIAPIDASPGGDLPPETPVDKRPTELLSSQRFGASEAQTSGVIFSAPTEDLVTPTELRTQPDHSRPAWPCLFLEDLWIGVCLDTAHKGKKLRSIHTQVQKIRFRNGVERQGSTEDYWDREQPDDPAQGHTSTELGTFYGLNSAQAKDYLVFLGLAPADPEIPGKPFRVWVDEYSEATRLLYRKIYQGRLRNVFLGGVRLSTDDADRLSAGADYSMVYPFFRPNRFRCGEFVASDKNDSVNAKGGVQTVFLSEDVRDRLLTLVPSPIDVEASRYHGLTLMKEDEEQRYRRRNFVTAVGEYFRNGVSDLNYFYDPNVYGIRIEARVLNGERAEANDLFHFAHGTYCQLKRHIHLSAVSLMYGQPGHWETFKPIELCFRTAADGAVRLHRDHARRVEVFLPPAAQVELVLIPLVEEEHKRRTAIACASSADTRFFGADLAVEKHAPLLGNVYAYTVIHAIHGVKRPLESPRLIADTLTAGAGDGTEDSVLGAREEESNRGWVEGRVELGSDTAGELWLDARWAEVRDAPEQERGYAVEHPTATTKPHTLVFAKFEPVPATARTFLNYFAPQATVSKLASLAPTATAATKTHVQSLKAFRIGRTDLGFFEQFELQCLENKIFLGKKQQIALGRSFAVLGVDLKDARRKRAEVTAVTKARFSERFPAVPSAISTRRSNPLAVDFPSKLELPGPRISHVVPIVATLAGDTGGQKVKRPIYALRVYVERPWFASGPGERLAFACQVAEEASKEAQELDKRITQWGEDPIERPRLAVSRRMPRASDFVLPDVYAFEGAKLEDALYPTPNDRQLVTYRDNVRVPGQGDLRVSLASYAMRWDPIEALWYCDIAVSHRFFGICGFAMYRHQPVSVEGRELSSKADWVYGAVLQGVQVAWFDRGGEVRVTVGPIHHQTITDDSDQPSLSYELAPIDFIDGVSEQVREGERVALQEFNVGTATYYEGVVARRGRKWSLIKTWFGHVVAHIAID